MDEFKEVPLERIVWKHPVRPVDLEHARSLAKSLRLHGQINPIIVKPPDPETGLYEGVVGRHRFEAAKIAVLPTIECRIRPFRSRAEEREAQLVENLHVLPLTTIERANAYEELHGHYQGEMPGDSDKAIIRAIATGVEGESGRKPPSEKTIHHYLQLSRELPEEVKRRLTGETGQKFGLRHGLELLRLRDKPDEQKRLAQKFVEASIRGARFTVERLKREVDAIIKPKGEPSPSVVSRDITYDCPYCGAEYHPFYQGEGDEPHRHGLKRIHRNAEGRETEKQPSLNFACLDCYSRFPTAVKTTIEGATHLTCPSCGSSNIKRLG